jgi:hypothetical protein
MSVVGIIIIINIVELLKCKLKSINAQAANPVLCILLRSLFNL